MRIFFTSTHGEEKLALDTFGNDTADILYKSKPLSENLRAFPSEPFIKAFVLINLSDCHI